MNEEKGCQAGASRMEKHIDLNNAIKGIYQVKDRADNLLSQIIHRSEPAVEDLESTKDPAPSLEDVLNESPERIHKVCEEIHKILEDIKLRLF